MSYLDTIKQGAIDAWHTRQILPSIAGAQAILETGSGTSDLARPPHNNHFGIKASADWTGRKVTMSTREYLNGSWVTLYDTFRSYDTITESFEDYGAFFTGTPWRTENYKHVVGETDYKRACWALQNSGYATDPQYATKLITRIENNNLQAWDVEALSSKVTKSPTSNKQVLTPAVKTVGGTLTNVAKETIKELNITMIGDSLGVGTRTHFQTLAPKANYDVVGSRQITHATNSLNATKVLTDMKNAGTLREYVVFIIGTNRGVTQTEVDNVVSIAGTDRKVLFVDTASEVNHASEVSNQYRQASVRHANAYYVNWAQHAKPMMAGWYSPDGTGGTYIHMTSEGYRNHAEYITQAVYQSSVGAFVANGEVAAPAETTQIGIKDIDLAEDGTVKFKGERILEDGTTVVVDETTNIGIEGLYSPLGDENIYYPDANSTWGGSGSVNSSLWIEGRFELSDEGDPIKLIKAAAVELIDRGQAAMQYTISLMDMPTGISIGDTGTFRDHHFNPPLYIQARVLEITTSETNPSANTVTIGNVTELIPQDNSDILALQKELKDSADRMKRENMGQQPLLAEIVSTNGFILGDAYNETQLMVSLKRGVDDVTSNATRVSWERVSNDSGADNAYNQKLESVRTATLTVLSGDIPNGYSKFVARLYNEADQLIRQADISIKKVESALWVESTEPTDAKDGATWVDENGKQWIKKDGEWEERVDQEVISQVRVEVEGAMEEAEQAKQDAVEAYEKAVTDAKAHADAEDARIKQEIGLEVDGAIDLAEQAKQEATDKANQALADAKAHAIAQDTALKAILQGEIGEAMAEAELAKQDAIKAYDDSIAEAERLVAEQDEVWQGKMVDYDEQVIQIESDVQSAQDKADQALRDVGISTDLAQTAKDLADTAKDNAQVAINNANSAIGDASTALTASQDAVSQAGTAMSDASQALSQAQELDGQFSDLSLTVDDLNAEVGLRLTSAEVNTLVDGKGLATATYVNNQITATADSIKADLTSVEGKIPQSYTEENLVLNSKQYVSNTDYLIKEYDLAKELTVGKEYTIVLEGGIGHTGTDQQFGIFFDNGGSRQGTLQALGNHIYKATFTLLQTGPDSGDKSKFRLYNLPDNTTGAVIKWIKLVEGKAKDNTYRPSLNELLMENDFTFFKGEYEITARNVSSRLTAIDSEGGRLSTAESLISQNATAISARLTTAQVNSLVDGKGLATATYVNNQITATADGIISEMTRVEGKIPQSYTEENLVQNSKEYVSNTTYIIKEYTLTKQLVVGKEYTIVLEGGIGLTGSDQQFGVYFDGGASSQGTLQPLGGGIYKKTFTLLQTGANSGDKSKFRLYNLPNNTTSAVIKWIKLVEGNVTENTHTLSMSDMLMENDFTVFKNTTEDTLDTINTELSKTAKTTDLNGMVTESVLSTKNYVTAGTMTTTLVNYAQKNNVPTNNQFNNLKNSYDSMEQTIGTNGNKIAQMVMTDSLFSTKVLASVEIGGRNYAVGTTDKMQYNQQILQYSGNIQANTSKNVYTLAELGAKVGDTYTASIYIGNSDGLGSGLRIDTQSRTSKYVSPKTMRNFATITFTVEEGDTEYRFFYANTSGTGATYNIEACKFQIEKGNKRTDWNPSPLDKADQSQVTQLAGSWALTLKSGGDIKTQINATTNAIRLKADLIHLSGTSLIDNAIIKSAMIDTLNVSKLTGTTADFTTMVTKALTADTITATMINANNSMFEKLFANSFATNKLAAQGAWITDANIVSLDAGTIKSGTIDTARLNATAIVTDGLEANVIKSEHITATEGLVNKIFSDEAYIKALTVKTTFVNQIKAVEIEAGKITSGTIATARLNAKEIVTNGLSANVVTSTHLKTDEALIDELFATSALIDRLTSKTAFISQLKAIDLVADKATFVKAGWQSLNSSSVIDGNRMRVQNTDGDFIEMNNSPELRSDDAAGTAVVLGKGRVHFYDSAGNSKGYVGTDIHTAGNRDFGTFLSKGGGTYRFARMAGAKSLTYDTYTVRAGRTDRVDIIEDMVIAGLLPDGNPAQFAQKSDMIAKFHGWSTLPVEWPAQSAGNQIRYRERTVATTGDAYQTIWKAGVSSGDTWKVWFSDEVVFEGGYNQSSDRRLKHDIEISHIAALDHIESLAFKQFKWNKDGKQEPLGIIAQDSGLIRRAGGTEEEMEGVDGFRSTMLALKGVQELNKIVKEQAEEIKQLKEIINQ